jgi:hypothetical protein
MCADTNKVWDLDKFQFGELLLWKRHVSLKIDMDIKFCLERLKGRN